MTVPELLAPDCLPNVKEQSHRWVYFPVIKSRVSLWHADSALIPAVEKVQERRVRVLSPASNKTPTSNAIALVPEATEISGATVTCWDHSCPSDRSWSSDRSWLDSATATLEANSKQVAIAINFGCTFMSNTSKINVSEWIRSKFLSKFITSKF